eukprot:3544025-Rhodomonas_salina.1
MEEGERRQKLRERETEREMDDSLASAHALGARLCFCAKEARDLTGSTWFGAYFCRLRANENTPFDTVVKRAVCGSGDLYSTTHAGCKFDAAAAEDIDDDGDDGVLLLLLLVVVVVVV